MNSSKSTDLISSRDALAMLCHAPRARIPCNERKNTRAPCAGRCARMISLTDSLNFCARGLPHQRRHRHGNHLPHRQMGIIIVIVVAIIGSVIGRAVVISSSPPPSSSSLSSKSLSTSSCDRARPSHRPALECSHASAALETRWEVPIGNGDRGRISCATSAIVVEGVLPDKLRMGGLDVCASIGDDNVKTVK